LSAFEPARLGAAQQCRVDQVPLVDVLTGAAEDQAFAGNAESSVERDQNLLRSAVGESKRGAYRQSWWTDGF
jgi:hypothetical protein